MKPIKNMDFDRSLSVRIFFIIFFLYFLTQLPVHFSLAGTRDEFSFLKIAKELSAAPCSLPLVWRTSNYLGYGAMYWILYILLLKAPFLKAYLAAGYFPMSFLSFFCAMVPPLVIFFNAYRRKSPYALFAVCLWLLFPVAWWTGKVTGPELPALAFGMAGAYFAVGGDQSRKKNFWGWFLIGTAIGIKITSIIFAVFCFLLNVLYRKINIKRLLIAGFVLIAGFFFANFFALFNFPFFLKQLMFKNAAVLPSWEHARDLAVTPGHYIWDQVYDGGLDAWMLKMPALAVLAVFAIFIGIPVAVWISFGVSAVVGIVYLSMNPHPHGWYLFPLIALVPLTIGYGKKPLQSWRTATVMGIIFIFTASNTGYVEFNRRQRQWHHQNMLAEKRVERSVYARLSSLNTDWSCIFNFSDVGMEMPFLSQFSPNAITEIFDSYQAWFNGPDFSIKPGARILILMGGRVTRFPNNDLARQLPSGFVERRGERFRVDFKETHNFVSLYGLEKI
jgi:hypothetical protein